MSKISNKLFRWSSLHSYSLFPYGAYFIAAALLGHFVLLDVHMKDWVTSIFDQPSAPAIQICSKFAISGEFKLMMTYYSLALLGIAAALGKFLCPRFIFEFPTLSHLMRSNILSTPDDVSRHYSTIIKRRVAPFFYRQKYYQLTSLADQLTIIKLSEVPEDTARACRAYKETLFDYMDRSIFLVPAANILIVASVSIVLTVASSLFVAISCVLSTETPHIF